MCACGWVGANGFTSSARLHQEDLPTSLLGSVSMGKEQKAVCSGGLVVEVEAAVNGGGGGGDGGGLASSAQHH